MIPVKKATKFLIVEYFKTFPVSFVSYGLILEVPNSFELDFLSINSSTKTFLKTLDTKTLKFSYIEYLKLIRSRAEIIGNHVVGVAFLLFKKAFVHASNRLP